MKRLFLAGFKLYFLLNFEEIEYMTLFPLQQDKMFSGRFTNFKLVAGITVSCIIATYILSFNWAFNQNAGIQASMGDTSIGSQEPSFLFVWSDFTRDVPTDVLASIVNHGQNRPLLVYCATKQCLRTASRYSTDITPKMIRLQSLLQRTTLPLVSFFRRLQLWKVLMREDFPAYFRRAIELALLHEFGGVLLSGCMLKEHLPDALFDKSSFWYAPHAPNNYAIFSRPNAKFLENMMQDFMHEISDLYGIETDVESCEETKYPSIGFDQYFECACLHNTVACVTKCYNNI